MFLFSYPINFINKQFNIFFSKYIPFTQFEPIIHGTQLYLDIRKQLLSQLEKTEPNSTNEIMLSQTIQNKENNPPVREVNGTRSIIKPIQLRWGKILLHYIHERRFDSFKRDMHQIYRNLFKNSHIADTKMIVGNRNRRDMRHEIIRKRPRQSLLKNKPRASKTPFN